MSPQSRLRPTIVMDALNPDREPIRDQFRFSHAVVVGGRNFTAEQVREFWK